MGTDVYRLNSATNNYELSDYVKSDEDINKETELKIREKYSVSDELKLNRLANVDPANTDFAEYNSFVELCRADGRAKKQAAAEARAALTEIELPLEDGQFEARKIYVRQ